MKMVLLLTAVFCMVLPVGFALAKEDHRHHLEAVSDVSGHADVKLHADCQHCGMDRNYFSHSRMLITYGDGSTVGTCSIHCMVTEIKAARGKSLKSLQVGDYVTKSLIDAEKAVWVIGGDKHGVMTRTPKWAFATMDSATEFINKHGGTLATFIEALAAAEKE